MSEQQQPPRRVTLKDVARLAGVSHQTVSRAINDKGEIDPDTRRRVLDAARELNYRPSRFARGLVRPGATTLGLIVSDVVNPFFPELIAGVIEAAEAKGWQVLISSTQNHQSREPEVIRTLAAQVDVLIGYLSEPDATLAGATEGVPLVVLGRPVHEPAFGGVVVDAAAGVRAAVAHLVASGHRAIGMIDCPTAAGGVPDRRPAFLAAMAEHGLTVADDAIIGGSPTVEDGEARFTLLRAARPDITAVFTFNDLLALGAYRAARRLGVSVPGDCAIVGFDGLPIGELIDPPLTSVAIDKRRMGAVAVAEAARLLAGEPAGRVTLPVELVVRGSA
ncbi:LacI family DNA-binding transcriptional regulator [Catenuloplanes atrovinosus]|uniref:LacI family transcriptional regulator n=1 Tax=Catenuloplanes atrovinosus TaxID=137266 RepID=A0AAE3YQQ0_9ACTN|nr:LacI family DNA-binding transcriptional regulator [Catenuloplanes atrovinosus]MDR7276579.1 LacI family transcriptional regulator [Catenuloplanes atrovinosus]